MDYVSMRQPMLVQAAMDLLVVIVSIVLPPVGVFLQVEIGKPFGIKIILTLLGYTPGIVHAVWVIAKYWRLYRRRRLLG
jgi:uncharacterized membrane protein YqaE (UPF0057 family)